MAEGKGGRRGEGRQKIRVKEGRSEKDATSVRPPNLADEGKESTGCDE